MCINVRRVTLSWEQPWDQNHQLSWDQKEHTLYLKKIDLLDLILNTQVTKHNFLIKVKNLGFNIHLTRNVLETHYTKFGISQGAIIY